MKTWWILNKQTSKLESFYLSETDQQSTGRWGGKWNNQQNYEHIEQHPDAVINWDWSILKVETLPELIGFTRFPKLDAQGNPAYTIAYDSTGEAVIDADGEFYWIAEYQEKPVYKPKKWVVNV